jgi:hypothetical protein
MPITPPENRESAHQSDVRKGKQVERVSSVEKVGSSDSNGIRFPVHNHHDHSDVRGSASKLKE